MFNSTRPRGRDLAVANGTRRSLLTASLCAPPDRACRLSTSFRLSAACATSVSTDSSLLRAPEVLYVPARAQECQLSQVSLSIRRFAPLIPIGQRVLPKHHGLASQTAESRGSDLPATLLYAASCMRMADPFTLPGQCLGRSCVDGSVSVHTSAYGALDTLQVSATVRRQNMTEMPAGPVMCGEGTCSLLERTSFSYELARWASCAVQKFIIPGP